MIDLENQFLVFFASGRFTQVLLYAYSVGSSRCATYYTDFFLYIMYFYMKTFVVVSTHIMYYYGEIKNNLDWGAQWLSGRVLDSRPRGRGFEPHRRHCVVVLEQDTFIVA